ncbi:hypothetical protein T05_2232 [Trichinella murrelli]|uniref:Uncharacterized protein n=1 Tax=Trichinella murrelli TaxID=144512 RepID=A0A0V0T6W2_9BILA|nr:hypothetical protein T05_2232 [Trichinella murrelli]
MWGRMGRPAATRNESPVADLEGRTARHLQDRYGASSGTSPRLCKGVRHRSVPPAGAQRWKNRNSLGGGEVTRCTDQMVELAALATHGSFPLRTVTSVADVNRANDSIPAENETEERLEAEYGSTCLRVWVAVGELPEKLSVLHRCRSLLLIVNKEYTHCLLFDCRNAIRKARDRKERNRLLIPAQ